MKENKRKCYKCGASPSDAPGIVLYRFPKPGRTNSLRCELWAKYCFPEGLWHTTELQLKLYTEHRMLCNKHFDRTAFIDDTHTKIFKSATPKMEPEERLIVCPVFEPTAGPSRSSMPLLENINILNTDSVIPELPQPNASSIINTDSARVIPNLPQPSVSNTVKQEHVKGPAMDKKQKYLHAKCKKHLRRIYRLQSKIKKMKNKSLMNEIVNNDSIQELMKCKMSPTLALLLQGDMKNFNKKVKARRWNSDAKIIALRLYKRSPMCYRLLRRLVCLPAPSTLKSLLNKFHLKTGLNDQIFNVLKKNLKNQKASDKEYILMFDEMSIKKNLFYNIKDDLIEGYQDHDDQGRCAQIASHALVFMIAGIRKKVKQPVAYYLSGGSVTADRLAVIVKKVLKHCFDAGLSIAATVCDMDGVNKRALSILGASVDRPYIEVGNEEIVTLFDTPHLLKCFRNLFMKYNIECPISIASGSGVGIAKWCHIQNFYELDNCNPIFVFAPCLKQEHLNPNTKQKMKVKLAAQVLSHSVASGMYAKISGGELPSEAVATANVIAKMNKLFDSVNASSPDQMWGKPLASNIQNNTHHLSFFKEMKDFFKKIKFLGCRSPPPSQEGWIWTLNGLERVWKNITQKHEDVKSLATRRLQQDPLENLFGCIRGNCGANRNPTAGQFVAGLKTAILSNLSHIVVGNCEEDDNNVVISNYRTLLAPAADICTVRSETDECNIFTDIDFSIGDNLQENSSQKQACAYVCGFIVKNKPIKSNDCDNCKNIFTTETQLPEHIFVEYKEYVETKKSLIYASAELITCVEAGANLVHSYLETESFKHNIKKNVSELIQNSVDFSFLEKCIEHKKTNMEYLIKSIVTSWGSG